MVWAASSSFPSLFVALEHTSGRGLQITPRTSPRVLWRSSPRARLVSPPHTQTKARSLSFGVSLYAARTHNTASVSPSLREARVHSIPIRSKKGFDLGKAADSIQPIRSSRTRQGSRAPWDRIRPNRFLAGHLVFPPLRGGGAAARAARTNPVASVPLCAARTLKCRRSISDPSFGDARAPNFKEQAVGPSRGRGEGGG